MIEQKLIFRTSVTDDHDHEVFVPEGPVSKGYYETNTVNGHFHDVHLEEDLLPGNTVRVVTSRAYGRNAADMHAHEVDVEAMEENPSEVLQNPRSSMETKVLGGRIVEVKQAVRNRQDVGIVSGYLATWDADGGGVFGVPDQFLRGAWTKSLQEHRDRGNRQVRLKDLHGRVIGGFPIETVREDDVGLFGVGEVNLQTQLGREAYSLALQGVLVDFSVGFSAVNDKIVNGVREIFQAVLWEASIVDEPANRNARILEVKVVVPFQDLPLADRERPWDSRAAIGRVRRFTDSTEAPSRTYRNAFVWYDRADAQNFGAYKLPIADVVDGSLVAVPRAIFAAAGRFNQTDIPEADRSRAVRHLERYYRKMDLPSPFSRDERQFFGVEEVKAFDVAGLREALQKSGAFTKAASRYLAGALTRPEESAYDGDEEKLVAEILRNLQESKRLLR